MVERHWHCMKCMALVATPVKADGQILCAKCDAIDWAKLPEMMLEKQEFAKKMGIDFDSDGYPIHLRKRTPEEREAYYHTKLALWQLEKRSFVTRLSIARMALVAIRHSMGLSLARDTANKALEDMDENKTGDNMSEASYASSPEEWGGFEPPTQEEKLKCYEEELIVCKVRKAKLHEKLDITIGALKKIANWNTSSKNSGTACKALNEIDAIGKESDDG